MKNEPMYAQRRRVDLGNTLAPPVGPFLVRRPNRTEAIHQTRAYQWDAERYRTGDLIRLGVDPPDALRHRPRGRFRGGWTPAPAKGHDDRDRSRRQESRDHSGGDQPPTALGSSPGGWWKRGERSLGRDLGYAHGLGQALQLHRPPRGVANAAEPAR